VQSKDRKGAVLQVAFLAVIGVAIGITLARLWPRVAPQLAAAHWAGLLVALVFALGYLGGGLLGWRATLEELGSRPSAASAARIYLVSQLGKYIPGSIWAALAMVRLGHEANLPRARMAYSFALSLAFSLLTGLTIGIPALVGQGGRYLVYAAIALLVMAPVLLIPRVLNTLLDIGLRLTRRGRLEQPLSARGIFRIIGRYAVTWLSGGLHICALTAALGADPRQTVLPSIAAYAVSSTLGILFVIAPAGAGVRDVLMVLLLGPAVGTATATAVALLSRVMLTFCDVGGAGAAALVWRRRGEDVAPSTPPAALTPDPTD
jgi:hypothetical protein